MTNKCRGIALIAATGLAVGACNSGTRAVVSEELAADQSLRFPVSADVGNLDPPQWVSGTDLVIIPNVFGGLYKLDDSLREVPDVAEGMPEVSPDGLTYTFHLRPDARFSNGDPVTASDVEYSWNRIARISVSGGNAGDIEPIVGVEEMVAGRAHALSGVSAPAEHTLVVHLSTASGQWFARLATFPYGAGLVDRKVVEARGEQTWWQTPAGLVGTGPFRMVSWVAKQYVELAPVANWWGGSTGTLTRIRIDIVPDQAEVERRYGQGLYDLIDDSAFSVGGATGIASHFRGDPTLARDVHRFPGGFSAMIGFDLAGGPFAGSSGKPGREAFSLALDRNQLIKGHPTIQSPATGGFIAPGLAGYLGDNSDPYARFDPAAARTAYRQWDPDGSLARNLKLTYSPNRFFTPIAQELHNQWMANLGVDVKLQPVDDQTFSDGLDRHGYTLFLKTICGGCGVENFPQFWFEQVLSNTGYDSPSVRALISAARRRPLDQALPDYLKAGQILVRETVVAALMYGASTIISKPYVKGIGAIGRFEHPWTEIKILKH